MLTVSAAAFHQARLCLQNHQEWPALHSLLPVGSGKFNWSDWGCLVQKSRSTFICLAPIPWTQNDFRNHRPFYRRFLVQKSRSTFICLAPIPSEFQKRFQRTIVYRRKHFGPEITVNLHLSNSKLQNDFRTIALIGGKYFGPEITVNLHLSSAMRLSKNDFRNHRPLSEDPEITVNLFLKPPEKCSLKVFAADFSISMSVSVLPPEPSSVLKTVNSPCVILLLCFIEQICF